MRFEVVSFDNAIHNVSPRVWGKGAWKYLHTSALVYPRDDDRSEDARTRRAAYREELRDLPLVVPCAECRGHLRDELAKIDIDAVDSYNHYNSVILWLHNQVRERQQKPPMRPEDVIAWLRKEGLDPNDCEACKIPTRTRAELDSSGLESDDSESDVGRNESARTALYIVGGTVALAVALGLIMNMRRRKSDERA